MSKYRLPKHERVESDLPIMRNDAKNLTVRSAESARVVKW